MNAINWLNRLQPSPQGCDLCDAAVWPQKLLIDAQPDATMRSVMITQNLADLRLQSGNVVTALSWVNHALLGSVGTSLAIIAVAWLGLNLAAGRMSLRHSGLLLLGCFIFFGAPRIAGGLLRIVQASSPAGQAPLSKAIVVPPPSQPPSPPPYDPYAGASVPNAQN